MSPIALKFRRLAHGEGLSLPARHSAGAAGLDLAAALDHPVVLAPGARIAMPTGFAVEIPPGHEGQVRPRSGLALKSGVTVLNAPGTIDWDYRGEVKVVLINLGEQAVTIARGDRIAQLVVAPVTLLNSVEVASLEETDRAESGFGSTGLGATP